MSVISIPQPDPESEIVSVPGSKPDKFENRFFLWIGLLFSLKWHFRTPKTELFENALQSG